MLILLYIPSRQRQLRLREKTIVYIHATLLCLINSDVAQTGDQSALRFFQPCVHLDGLNRLDTIIIGLYWAC